jgi:hypothetical protein
MTKESESTDETVDLICTHIRQSFVVELYGCDVQEQAMNNRGNQEDRVNVALLLVTNADRKTCYICSQMGPRCYKGKTSELKAGDVPTATTTATAA